MKFVSIAKWKDTALMLPPATLIQVTEASMAAIDQQTKEGKILETYYLPEIGRQMFMLNYDNADQWAKDQIKIPALRYADYETYALASYKEYAKSALEAAKAALKMMPATK